ncbi:uncharacterized protein LOC141595693 [Silene latifolia]|uniref:uncharacterized protein LOC141595693 n=1 Tax=Silene latifolia TaxID=37657 RepID=UPI003D78B0A3
MKSTIDSSQIPKSKADIFPDDQDLQSNGQDDEETLSLRDLPITVNSDHRTAITTNHGRQSSSSSSSDSFFEFSTNVDDTSDVTSSTADDVILDGHLLPFAPPPPRLPRRSLSLSSAVTQSESDTNSAVNRSSNGEFRPSRSLNCRKLRRSDGSAKADDTTSLLYSRSLSGNSRGNSSPWYHWLIFGLPVRIPAEIEMKDIKNRQTRRKIPPSRFFSGDRSSSSSSSASWRVLSVLSCKNHSSVDVLNTPPIFRQV